MLFKTITNGSSELLSNVAASVVSILKFAGEDGVSAHGIIMYESFIFAAVFMGYGIGITPVVSFNYGSQNHDELKNVLKKSIIMNIAIGAVLILPMAFELNGIWAAIIVAEGLAFVLDTIFLITNKKKYQY